MKVRVTSLDVLQKVAEQVVLHILPAEEGARVVALSGDLGAGKTTFVQMMARALGVRESVASPTYILQRSYRIDHQTFTTLVHIDAYRLSDERELSHIGWSDILSDRGALVCVEWPERIPNQIPHSALRIRFDIDGEERIITIDGETKDLERITL